MANGTTITESGTELLPARPGQERGTPTGWIQDLVYTVDHKKLGMLYVGTGLFFFVVAGIMALLIRAQLAFPNGRVTSPGEFNALITVHARRGRDQVLRAGVHDRPAEIHVVQVHVAGRIEAHVEDLVVDGEAALADP